MYNVGLACLGSCDRIAGIYCRLPLEVSQRRCHLYLSTLSSIFMLEICALEIFHYYCCLLLALLVFLTAPEPTIKVALYAQRENDYLPVWKINYMHVAERVQSQSGFFHKIDQTFVPLTSDSPTVNACLSELSQRGNSHFRCAYQEQ